MKRIDELSNLEQKQQKFYELGQFGMYNVLKDLEKQGLYLQPLIIGMLDNLIAATFKKVGNEDTFGVYGTPYCGKGEPNQGVRVGHASPVCLFNNVEIFGGA